MVITGDDLTDEEMTVINAIDGALTLGEICRRADIGQDRTKKILDRLINKNVVAKTQAAQVQISEDESHIAIVGVYDK